MRVMTPASIDFESIAVTGYTYIGTYIYWTDDLRRYLAVIDEGWVGFLGDAFMKEEMRFLYC